MVGAWCSAAGKGCNWGAQLTATRQASRPRMRSRGLRGIIMRWSEDRRSTGGGAVGAVPAGGWGRACGGCRAQQGRVQAAVRVCGWQRPAGTPVCRAGWEGRALGTSVPCRGPQMCWVPALKHTWGNVCTLLNRAGGAGEAGCEKRREGSRPGGVVGACTRAEMWCEWSGWDCKRGRGKNVLFSPAGRLVRWRSELQVPEPKLPNGGVTRPVRWGMVHFKAF